MTPAELAAIRARANNATEGPWEASEAVDDTEFGSYVAYGVAPIAPLEWYSDSDAAHTALDVMDKADAEFIAHARVDVPALLDHVDQLQSAFDAAHLTSLDLLGHRNQLAEQLFAVSKLIDEFETEDIMPPGQVALLRAALEGETF